MFRLNVLSTILCTLFLVAACTSNPSSVSADDTPVFFPTAATSTSIPTPLPTHLLTQVPSPTARPLVPAFTHIVIFMLENKEFSDVIGDSKMPIYNRLAQHYTLMTQYYAISHPSLPNYIALISGDTLGITTDCEECYVNAPNLADLIEASGRTWKTYQEDMPSPCYAGDSEQNYVKRHNPFIYFDSIRLNQTRCEQSVVPLTALQTDIDTGQLPNFMFITPNLCNDVHDCGLDFADEWLTDELNALVPALDKTGEPYLIVLNWDEGQGTTSCCGLPDNAGGRIPVVLISPQVKNNFQDDTPYTHYSLLKTIAKAWNLSYLSHAADDNNALITAPWK